MSKKILSCALALIMCMGAIVTGFAPVETSADWGDEHTCNNTYQQTVSFYYPPTCTTQGYTQWTCTICGASKYDYTDALGHTAGKTVITQMPTCTQDGQTVTTCTRCGAPMSVGTLPKTGHDSGVWKVDFEATTEHNGQMSRYCKKCGYVLETKSFLAHSHRPGYTATLKEATCTAYGQKGTFCADCQACYATTEIAPTGHTDADDSVWAITTPATCTAAGEETGYCATCGTIVGTRSVDALGHDDGVWCKSKIADCTSSGEERCYCTRCGEVINKNILEPLGHTGDNWTVTAEATCLTDGEKVCTCERCGVVYRTETIESTGHDDGVWRIDFEPNVNVVDENGQMYGQMTRYCSICNVKLETKIFYKHEHSEGYTRIVKPAGCLTSGETETVCAKCDAVYATSVLEPLGHNYSPWAMNNDGTHSRTCDRCGDVQKANCVYDVQTTAATCENSGSLSYTCTICGYNYVGDETFANGHTFGAWHDCKDGVTHERSCSDCGKTEYGYHLYDDWKTEDNRTFWESFVEDETITHTCAICGASESQLVPHTSYIAKVAYPIGYWFVNLIRKAFYAITLDWLFPWVNIPYEG